MSVCHLMIIRHTHISQTINVFLTSKSRDTIMYTPVSNKRWAVY